MRGFSDMYRKRKAINAFLFIYTGSGGGLIALYTATMKKRKHATARSSIKSLIIIDTFSGVLTL
jgi:hypothetical protein